MCPFVYQPYYYWFKACIRVSSGEPHELFKVESKKCSLGFMDQQVVALATKRFIVRYHVKITYKQYAPHTSPHIYI